MSSLVISGDTSGTVTVTVPAVAGTNTATLPAVTGTVMVSGNMPAFSAWMTANQSINSATLTLIQFNTVSGTSGATGFDTNSAFNTSTYKFQPTVAGYYYITASLQGPSTATGYLSAFLYKNATLTYNLGAVPNVVGGGVITGSAIVYLNGSTDYAQIYGYQTSGIAANIFSGSPNGSYFTGGMIRGA